MYPLSNISSPSRNLRVQRRPSPCAVSSELEGCVVSYEGLYHAADVEVSSIGDAGAEANDIVDATIAAIMSISVVAFVLCWRIVE